METKDAEIRRCGVLPGTASILVDISKERDVPEDRREKTF